MVWLDRESRVWPAAEFGARRSSFPGSERPSRVEHVLVEFNNDSQESGRKYFSSPLSRSMCLSKGCADICCITGGITIILGTLSAISGIFPRGQTQTRLFLECMGCGMIVFGLLVVFLGLKLRERGNLRTNPADEIIASLDCSSNVNISSYRTSLSRSSNNNNNNENTNTNHTSDSNCRPSGGQIKLSSLPSNSINDKLTMSSYWSTSANDSSYRSSNASSNNNKPNFETHLSPPLPSVENRLLAFPYDSRTSSSPTEHIGHQSTANGAHKSAQDAPETSPVIALDLAEPIESNFCQDDSKQQQQQQQQRLTPTPSDSALELSKGMNFLMNHRRRQQTQQQRLRRRRLSKKRVCARRIRWTQLTGGLNGAFGRRNNNNNNHKMRLAAIEAALSTVVTVSTLVGTRHTSLHNFESQQHFCCLEHAIQQALCVKKWINRCRKSSPVANFDQLTIQSEL